jgi:hypothetical protein
MTLTDEAAFSKFVSVLVAFVQLSGSTAATALVIPCCRFLVGPYNTAGDLNRFTAIGQVSQL